MEKSNQVQQDNGNLSIYERVRCVPKEAKKEIEAGRLKGKYDITDEVLSLLPLRHLQEGVRRQPAEHPMGSSEERSGSPPYRKVPPEHMD